MNTILIFLSIMLGCALFAAILQIIFGDSIKNQNSVTELKKNRKLNNSHIESKSSSIKVNNPNIDPRNKYSMLNGGYKPKSKQDAIARVKFLEVEQRELQSTLNRHTQIIQESLNIIYNSKNIETIKSRYDTIVEHYNYSMEYKKAGYDVNLPFNFLSDLRNEYNKRLVEISKIKTYEYNLKYNSLKTEKAKDNHTKKIYNELENIESSLIYSANSSKVKNDLNDLRNKIEDIYS